MRTVLRVCILTFLMCLSSSATFADSFGNNGFETGGFTGWSTIGDTLVVTSRFGAVPAGGKYQALISNAPSTGDVPNPGYPSIN